MNTHSLLSRFCHFSIPRRIAVALVMFVALVWSGPAFCGEIHDAAKNGDLARVQALLKDNPNSVFSKDDHGLTALHWAAYSGNKEVAELLLANKADVNAKSNDGSTPLHIAALTGQGGVAELLLANNAEVNAKDSKDMTPFQLAVLAGKKDVAELLRQHGGQAVLVNAEATSVGTRMSGSETPTAVCVVHALVRDVNSIPVRNAVVALERAGETLHLTANSAGEYSSSFAAVGGPVRITVTSKGFEPAAVETIVPEGSTGCRADITLFKKGHRKVASEVGVLACEEPAPYAAMLSFQAEIECLPGASKCTNMFLFGDYVLQVNYTPQATPPSRQLVTIHVPRAPASATWSLSNPDLAVLSKIDSISAHIQFVKDGKTELLVRDAGEVLLRVHLRAGTGEGFWQVIASRVNEKGEIIDGNGRVVKSP